MGNLAPAPAASSTAATRYQSRTGPIHSLTEWQTAFRVDLTERFLCSDSVPIFPHELCAILVAYCHAPCMDEVMRWAFVRSALDSIPKSLSHYSLGLAISTQSFEYRYEKPPPDDDNGGGSVDRVSPLPPDTFLSFVRSAVNARLRPEVGRGPIGAIELLCECAAVETAGWLNDVNRRSPTDKFPKHPVLHPYTRWRRFSFRPFRLSGSWTTQVAEYFIVPPPPGLGLKLTCELSSDDNQYQPL